MVVGCVRGDLDAGAVKRAVDGYVRSALALARGVMRDRGAVATLGDGGVAVERVRALAEVMRVAGETPAAEIGLRSGRYIGPGSGGDRAGIGLRWAPVAEIASKEDKPSPRADARRASLRERFHPEGRHLHIRHRDVSPANISARSRRIYSHLPRRDDDILGAIEACRWRLRVADVPSIESFVGE